MALEQYMEDEEAAMPKWFTDKYGSGPESKERYYKLMERNPEAVGRTEEGPEGNTAMGEYFDEPSEDDPTLNTNEKVIDTSEMTPEELKEHRKAKIRARNEAEGGEDEYTSQEYSQTQGGEGAYQAGVDAGADAYQGRGEERRNAMRERRAARREGRGGRGGGQNMGHYGYADQGGDQMERWRTMLQEGGEAANRMDPARLEQLRGRWDQRGGGQGGWGSDGPDHGGAGEGGENIEPSIQPAEATAPGGPGGRNARTGYARGIFQDGERVEWSPEGGGEEELSFSQTMEQEATRSGRPDDRPYARPDAQDPAAAAERKKRRKKKRGQELEEYVPENQPL